VKNKPGLCSFNQNLHNLHCEILQIRDNKAISFLEAGVTDSNNTLPKSHIPKNSHFFEKVVPAALIGMGIITVALILFAAGVLLGLIKF